MSDAPKSQEQRKLVGRPFPKGKSGNPSGRPLSYKDELRKLIGPMGGKAYEVIWEIANGKASYKVPSRAPKPWETASDVEQIPEIEKVPNFAERLAAAEFLAEQLNGKSTQQVDVKDVTAPEDRRLDVTKLTLEELYALRALRERASSDVVDAELVPKELPGGEPSKD